MEIFYMGLLVFVFLLLFYILGRQVNDTHKFFKYDHSLISIIKTIAIGAIFGIILSMFTIGLFIIFH